MYGSTTVSLVSVFLLMLVSRVLGEESAGIFSLCYSTGQMLYTVAAFELRTIQVTDTKQQYTFGDMLGFRFCTALFMLLFSVGFLLVRGFAGIKLSVGLLIVLYMAVMSFSDVFQGILHQNGHLALAGLSAGTGVLAAAAAFVVTMLLTKNLVIAVIPMSAVYLLWVLFYDMPLARNFSSLKPRFHFSSLKSLFLTTAPLVISVFMNQYNLNSPKYAIDKFLTEIDQSHYGYLVMPAFVINLLSIFVFRPQIVPLSKMLAAKDFKGFRQTALKLYGWIGLVTAAALTGAYFLGIPILSWFYNTDLSGCEGYLLLLLIGGAFSAGSSLTLVFLSIMRKQNFCLVAYSLAFLVALFLPNALVRSFGFAGAIYSYLSVTLALFLGLSTAFLISFHRAKKAG